MICKQSWLRNSILLAVATASLCSAGAQSTTQGAIAGTVQDATSAVIPNATVIIHNDGTNAETKLSTDSSGFFKAPLLEPGIYTVSISATGFASYVAKTVTVEVGKQTQVMPHLAAGATESTVQVSADQPLLNYESPDMSTVLNRKAVDDIPVYTKRWSALALTTPGVTVDTSGYGLVQVRGISPLLNNVEIDGADDNQAYFAEERGRTRESYSSSPNAVREFQVNTGVYSAQYGRAAGGVINSVTRSGANDWHGELFFNDVDRGFGAYQPGNVDAYGKPLKPKDLRKVYGGAVGGHIIKDKLFFFYTYDQVAHIFPAVAKAANFGASDGSQTGSLLEKPDVGAICNPATGAVTAGTTVAHATLDGQVCFLAGRTGMTYANAVNYYNNGVSALLTDLGIVPRTGFQGINTPKVDWQINDKNRLSLVYHRLRWDSPGGVQTGSTGNYSIDAFGTDFVKLDYGVAKLTSQFGPKLSNEILYQYGRELNDEGQQPYSAYTLNNLVAPGGRASGGFQNGPGGTIPYITLSTATGTQFNLGSPYYSYRPAYPDERKWQIADTAYFSLGNHSIKVGVDFVHNNDLQNSQSYYFGLYSYSNLSNYFSDLASKGKTTGTCSTTPGAGFGTAPCFSTLRQDFGTQTAFEVQTLDSGYFIQDNWKVSPRLTLELGVRYDYESFPQPFSNFTVATSSFTPYAGLTNRPSDKDNIGPRIGFSYDIFGTGRTVMRGGYGMYYGRIINSTIASVYSGTGSNLAQYDVSGLTPANLPTLTFPYPATGGTVKPSSYFFSPNLQNPQVHEFDLQIQQDLGRGTIFQISYLGSLGRQLPNFIDVNLAAPTTSVTTTVVAPTVTSAGLGPLGIGSSYTFPLYTSYINPNFNDITEVVSNVNSSYHAAVFELQNRMIHGIQFDANYTWSHALDYNQNAYTGVTVNTSINPLGSLRQNYGNSAFNVGNRFAGYVLYTFPKPHFSGNSGWMNYVAGGWSINDSFQMQNGLPYSATLNTSYKIASTALRSGTINGVPGSGSTSPGLSFLPMIGINTYQVPRVIVDDLRLQKAFQIKKYSLELNADMYNVANHQNYSPGASGNLTTTAYAVTGTPTATKSNIVYNPRTTPYAGFGSHSAANSAAFSYIPREFQIGARLQF